MSSYKTKKTPGNTAWFTHDRFGMFIHFGIYAMAARHEWVKYYESTPEAQYQKYFDHFDPDLFDAREWAKAAKKAGMKYAVLTTKHHDGFCLFDSAVTDYKITNTPFGRDLVKEYVEAFRAEGLKVGFYYSLIDWHHPMFPLDKFHPRRNDANAPELDRGRDMTVYAKYMRDQVTELLTNYGKIDILWLDWSYPEEWNAPEWMQFGGTKGKDQWESEKLIATVRSIAPEIIINNRADLKQDLWTPEQFQPIEWVKDEETGEKVVWEACQTFSGSWGYYRDEFTWKSPEMLINMLVNTVSIGGNLIMNVGPTSRGYFDHRATEALDAYAAWMKVNGRSIYGCTMAEPEFKAPEGTKLTQSEDGKRLYIHLQTYPFGALQFPGLDASRVEYAQFLSDGSEVRYRAKAPSAVPSDHMADRSSCTVPTTVFVLPTVRPYGLSPVIEVFLK
ncbi:MAG: alpha-L-fucosidase [Lachnospiraceae bacterium]|nr:alpha-L-fucosidase [Lachnospiraceae bacterium]